MYIFYNTTPYVRFTPRLRDVYRTTELQLSLLFFPTLIRIYTPCTIYYYVGTYAHVQCIYYTCLNMYVYNVWAYLLLLFSRASNVTGPR